MSWFSRPGDIDAAIVPDDRRRRSGRERVAAAVVHGEAPRRGIETGLIADPPGHSDRVTMRGQSDVPSTPPARLHAAGWSIGDAVFHDVEHGAIVQVVIGGNGENPFRAEMEAAAAADSVVVLIRLDPSLAL